MQKEFEETNYIFSPEAIKINKRSKSPKVAKKNSSNVVVGIEKFGNSDLLSISVVKSDNVHGKTSSR